MRTQLMRKSLFSLKRVVTVAMVALFALLPSSILLSTPVHAEFEPTGYPILDAFADFLDPDEGDVYAYFEVEVNLDNVAQATMANLLMELTNDDLWYSGAADTTVIREGWGSEKIGRQWRQDSVFNGVPTVDIVTRLWADSPNYQVVYADGTFADYVTYAGYDEYPAGGGSTYTYVGLFKPNFPVPQELLDGFFAAVPIAFENDLTAYFNTTGSASLNELQYFTF